jgi:hypothetical protein
VSARRIGSKDKIRKFFEEHVGEVVTTKEIRKLTRISEYARRIRELRDDEGMQIFSHNDRADLKPGEYILVSLERVPRFSHKIDKVQRARILERNGLTCAMCGVTAGDPDPYTLGRKIRLHIDHINPDGLSVDENLRVLCNNCNEGRSNLAIPPAPNTLSILRQIRKLPRGEQTRILEELRKKLDPKP